MLFHIVGHGKHHFSAYLTVLSAPLALYATLQTQTVTKLVKELLHSFRVSSSPYFVAENVPSTMRFRDFFPVSRSVDAEKHLFYIFFKTLFFQI
jgi:hypothetical protein